MKRYGFEPNARRYTVNRSALDDAREMRRKFYDQEPQRERPVPWQWPRSMQEVGTCEAVMYVSDKWSGVHTDYKHNKEGPQTLLVTPGFLRAYGRPGSELEIEGPMRRTTDMPDAFAELAPILGIQARLYTVSDDGESYDFPADPEDGYYQIDIARAWLGAIRHPRSGRTSLVVYTASGVHCLITGPKLSVERDGITG